MSDDFPPVPEPSGALVPPRRVPPTAVATATPPPPRPLRPARAVRRGGLLETLRRGITAVLDAADTAGDAIAGAIGLRGGGSR